MRGLAAFATCWNYRSAKRSLHTTVGAGLQRSLSLWRRHKWVSSEEVLRPAGDLMLMVLMVSRQTYTGRVGCALRGEGWRHLVSRQVEVWRGEKSRLSSIRAGRVITFWLLGCLRATSCRVSCRSAANFPPPSPLARGFAWRSVVTFFELTSRFYSTGSFWLGGR